MTFTLKKVPFYVLAASILGGAIIGTTPLPDPIDGIYSFFKNRKSVESSHYILRSDSNLSNLSSNSSNSGDEKSNLVDGGLSSRLILPSNGKIFNLNLSNSNTKNADQIRPLDPDYFLLAQNDLFGTRFQGMSTRPYEKSFFRSDVILKYSIKLNVYVYGDPNQFIVQAIARFDKPENIPPLIKGFEEHLNGKYAYGFLIVGDRVISVSSSHGEFYPVLENFSKR